MVKVLLNVIVKRKSGKVYEVGVCVSKKMLNVPENAKKN